MGPGQGLELGLNPLGYAATIPLRLTICLRYRQGTEARKGGGANSSHRLPSHLSLFSHVFPSPPIASPFPLKIAPVN